MLALCALTAFFVFLCVMQLIGGEILWFIFLLTFVLLVGTTFVVMNFWGRWKNYPFLYKAWTESWRCLQCGVMFTKAEADQSRPPIVRS